MMTFRFPFDLQETPGCIAHIIGKQLRAHILEFLFYLR